LFSPPTFILPLTLPLSPEGRGNGGGVHSPLPEGCPKDGVFSPSPYPSPSRGEGFPSLTSPQWGEDEGEGVLL